MKTLLILLTGTIAFTAIIIGGLMISAPDGSSLKISPLLLEKTPFKNFVIPGLILLFMVGGSNLIATFALMQRHKKAFSFSLLAGALTSIWIMAEMIMTSTIYWLEFAYFVVGICIMLISSHLKGKALI